jgi:O-antigen/teichoic acid export membrane protein
MSQAAGRIHLSAWNAVGRLPVSSAGAWGKSEGSTQATGMRSGGSVASSADDSQGIPSSLDDVDADDAGRAANRKQIRGSSLLLVGRMIGLALDFVSQVLIVRYLEKTEYGAFALAMSIVAIGATICLLGLERTVGRFAPIYQEKGDLGRMWGTIIVIVVTVITIGLALVLAVYAFQGLIGGVVDNDLALAILLLMIVLSPLQALDSLLIALFATFGSARSIFFRRYIVAPVLQLGVVVVLIATDSGVRFLALGYVVAAAIGIAIYSVVLIRMLQRQGLLKDLRRDTLRLPAREIFGFSIPLLASDVVMVLRSSLTVVFLEILRNTDEVADYRAVVPLAVQNLFVATSFRFIFTPGASRLFARGDSRALNELYWQTAVWIAILSFPLFALCVGFGEPVTVLLFGEQYRSAGIVLSILCIGYYVNGSMGFNSLLLRVFGRVRYMVTVDLATGAVSLVATLLLINAYGAVGAAIGTTISFVMQNLLYQWGLRTRTTVVAFDGRYLRAYLSIVIGAIAVIAAGLLEPAFLVGIVVVGAVSLVVLALNRHSLQIV